MLTIVLVSIAWTVRGQWREFQTVQFNGNPDWRYVLLSGALVLSTYALLVELWRRILGAWSAHIRFSDAVRIWCVSNLGKYVPGKVWQILAMGKMAEDVAVPPVAAAGSAILNTVVQIAMGCVVGVVAGWRALESLTRGHAMLGVMLATLILTAVLLLPMMLPPVLRVAERLTRRSLSIDDLPRRAIYLAVGGNVVAWVLYGWAFQWFVRGVMGAAAGTLAQYTAAYAISYVIGYLAFLIPGGLGFREAALVATLHAMGLANIKEAGVIAVTSRLWLTVLEIVPGLLFLALRRRRQRIPDSRDDTRA